MQKSVGVGKHFCRVYDTSILDYINGSKDKRFLFRVPIEYPYNDTPLDPYIVGAWLGDGTKSCIAINSEDQEIIDAWDLYFSSFSNLHRKEYAGSGCVKVRYSINGMTYDDAGRRFNPILRQLKSHISSDGFRIKNEYLINSRSVRLEMLAGLIDTDGNKPKGRQRYIFVTIYDSLKDDVVLLAKSLGFRVSFSKHKNGRAKSEQKTGIRNSRFIRTDGTPADGKDQWSVIITGNELDEIPCKLPRKKVLNIQKREMGNPGYGFSVVPKGRGTTYNIITDGDGRILLSDYIVMHDSCNRGKQKLDLL